MNTTDSAVRITHVPTGFVVTMQDERSQLQNRTRAMQVLRARLFELAERERDAELSAERRSQVGGGGRSEKIRTYNYKENRVTDHRIGFTIYRLADVLAGDLDDVVDALAADERARQLAERRDGVTGHGVTWRELWPRPTATVGERTEARWLCEVATSASTATSSCTCSTSRRRERMVAHLDAMVAALPTGEPLQYVLGRWCFRHLDLAVDRRVLIPRPETELVAGAAIELARALAAAVTVADLGTGSGRSGCRSRPSCRSTAPPCGSPMPAPTRSTSPGRTSPASAAGPQRAGRRGLVVRRAAGRRALRRHRVQPAVRRRRFDRTRRRRSVDWEPPEALFAGPDGLDDIGTIVATPTHRLVPGGWPILEDRAGQGAAVRDRLAERGFTAVEIRRDLADRDRIAIAQRDRDPTLGGCADVAFRARPMDLEFSGEIIHWRGPAPFHFVADPGGTERGDRSRVVARHLRLGAIPAKVRIGDTEFRTSLVPEGRALPGADQGRRAQGRASRAGRHRDDPAPSRR